MNFDKFYNSIKWKRTRQKRLIKDNYLCQECKRKGIYKSALIVHHIEPINDNINNAYNINNLISLCLNCHNKMHNRNDNQALSFYGLQVLKREERKLKRTNYNS